MSLCKKSLKHVQQFPSAEKKSIFNKEIKFPSAEKKIIFNKQTKYSKHRHDNKYDLYEEKFEIQM